MSKVDIEKEVEEWVEETTDEIIKNSLRFTFAVIGLGMDTIYKIVN